MFKLLPKSKYPTEMLYDVTEHTLIMYVQFVTGFQRKTSPLSFQNDSEHFDSDNSFKRLKFDNSSSETV